MEINAFLSGPNGPIAVDDETAKHPFLISPTEQHPFLTLGDYFNALAELISEGEGSPLSFALKQRQRTHLFTADIQRIDICSEKHGALYHIARLKVFTAEQIDTFAVTIALSEKSRASLRNEFAVLRTLFEKSVNSHLPAPYLLAESVLGDGQQSETILMMLGEWLEGYHEWHLSLDNQERQQIILWDTSAGSRYLSREESCALIRQAAGILTHFFEPQTGSHIHPWHHAAGDFIVRAILPSLKVKLITARNFLPLLTFPAGDENNYLPLIAFLLHLTLRIRLDRLDGTGAPALLDAFALPPSLDGFFKEYAEKDKALQETELLDVLQSFSRAELLHLYTPLLDLYQHEDSEEHVFILRIIDRHVDELWQCLQDYSAPII